MASHTQAAYSHCVAYFNTAPRSLCGHLITTSWQMHKCQWLRKRDECVISPGAQQASVYGGVLFSCDSYTVTPCGHKLNFIFFIFDHSISI